MNRQQTLQAPPCLEHLGWRYFAQGSYNFAYISQCGQYVLKIPKNNQQYSEDPRRSLEVFCEIHPEWADETKMFHYHQFTGWIMPYFQGRNAHDSEISKKLIDIYQRTSRIILDASSNQNFICTPYDEVICIDVGFAFRIQSSLRYNASDTSLIQWSHFKNRYNYDFFVHEQNKLHFPQTMRPSKHFFFYKPICPILLPVILSLTSHMLRNISLTAMTRVINYPIKNLRKY